MANYIKYEGELDLNGLKIPCYVLDNGTRVLSTTGMQKSLGVIGNEPEQRSSGRLNEILESQAVKPHLLGDGDASKFNPIICLKGNKKISAYKATVLPDICEAILKARDGGMILGKRQKIVAIQAEIIIRALAKVGIIALVDEATGYQYDREQRELQTILKYFISEEILVWQQAFHLNFYKEIFRLWGVPFTNQNISRKPQFIGKLTNELVYKNLPKGTFILEKLKAKTPKTIGGNFRYRLHQSLTPDVGREALKKVIYSVETLAVVSNSKEQFRRLVEDRYGQREIHFAEFWDLVETHKIENPSDFDKNLLGLLSVPPEDK
jgi:hypothetical protein